MCLTPIKVKNKTWHSTIAPQRKDGGTVRPHKDDTTNFQYNIVPCGQCPACKHKRVQGWVFRLLQEDKRHRSACFATLTYRNEEISITRNGFMNLVKKDYQDFMKRLRFNTGCKTIRYYAAGEYGDTRKRPHFHAIIFDVTEDDIITAWTRGEVHFGEVTGNSIAYTAKYINKDKRIPMHEMDDRTPEFSLMSKKMGLNYVTEETKKWHRQKMAGYVIDHAGYKNAMPRYFKERIFEEGETHEMNRKAQEEAREKLNKAIEKAGSEKQFYHNQFQAIKHLTNEKRDHSKRRTTD